jgi:hypothetical protein
MGRQTAGAMACYRWLVFSNQGNVVLTRFAMTDGVIYRTQDWGAIAFRSILIVLALSSFAMAPLHAESAADPTAILPASPVAEAPEPQSGDRILGVIPNYQTVNDSSVPVAPLTPGQKWKLALRSTMDPFNIANSLVGAGFSQAGNQTPKYGEGGSAFAMRFGAAWADLATQNFFSAGLLATVLHQDPRYYRLGPSAGVLKRIAYSASRIAVARQDSGRNAFNASGIFGMSLGIVASNAYYPSKSVSGEVMAARLSTSLTSSLVGNLMSEFWPDIQKKFFHKH